MVYDRHRWSNRLHWKTIQLSNRLFALSSSLFMWFVRVLLLFMWFLLFFVVAIFTNETIELIDASCIVYVVNTINNIHKPMHFLLGIDLRHAESVWSLDDAVRCTSTCVSPTCSYTQNEERKKIIVFKNDKIGSLMSEIYCDKYNLGLIFRQINSLVAYFATVRWPFDHQSPMYFDPFRWKRHHRCRRQMDRSVGLEFQFHGKLNPTELFALKMNKKPN